MKKYIICCILGMLVWETGCYEDKGNYSYGEINEMTLGFSPATTTSNPDLYVFPQPPQDTLFFELTPVVEQTRETDTDNLECCWQLFREKVDEEEKFDTVYSKSYVFKFAPGVPTVYDVLFSVRDKGNGVERYRRLKLKTSVPFIRSWLILHGKEGDRKIGALEYDTTGMIMSRQVEDICFEVKGERLYQDAFAMCFVSDGLPRALNDDDRLYLLTPEQCYWLHPFTCEERAATAVMMPRGWTGRFKSCIATDARELVDLVDEAGNYFHCGAFGFFYKAAYKNGIAGAHVDLAYTSARAYTTLWDGVNRRFMYYQKQVDLYESRENIRQAEDHFDKKMLMSVFPDKAMLEMDSPEEELVWLGRAVASNAETGGSAIFRNTLTGEYSLFHVAYEQNMEDASEFVSTWIQKLKNIDFRPDSKIAVTESFTDQIFYSSESEVYLYNTINGYTSFLYSVGKGNKITKLDFRMINKGTIEQDFSALKILGVGVETTAGEGEFHELFLDESGDVVKHAVYRGFGPVMDFCYTALNHMKYDL